MRWSAGVSTLSSSSYELRARQQLRLSVRACAFPGWRCPHDAGSRCQHPLPRSESSECRTPPIPTWTLNHPLIASPTHTKVAGRWWWVGGAAAACPGGATMVVTRRHDHVYDYTCTCLLVVCSLATVARARGFSTGCHPTATQLPEPLRQVRSSAGHSAIGGACTACA